MMMLVELPDMVLRLIKGRAVFMGEGKPGNFSPHWFFAFPSVFFENFPAGDAFAPHFFRNTMRYPIAFFNK